MRQMITKKIEGIKQPLRKTKGPIKAITFVLHITEIQKYEFPTPAMNDLQSSLKKTWVELQNFEST